MPSVRELEKTMPLTRRSRGMELFRPKMKGVIRQAIKREFRGFL
jgi:hypothetical protein